MFRRCLGLAALLSIGCDDHLFPGAGAGDEACEPTWAGVQVFMGEHCLTCHGGPDAPSGKGIVLPTAVTDDLNDLSVPLFPDYGGEFVVPGDRANSVLWLAVSHDGSIPVMPIGTIDPVGGHECVGEWIDNGALLDE